MKIMLENNIKQKKYIINTLMNRNKSIDFDIDTAYALTDYKNLAFDDELFTTKRSDIKAIEKEISVNILK